MAIPLTTAGTELALSRASAKQPRQTTSRAGAAVKPAFHPDTAPWSASRCMRILRRLESRLASLRKLVDQAPKDVQRAPAAATTQRSAKRPSRDDSKDDQNQQRKRPRITYGGRKKKQRIAPKQREQETPPQPIRTLRAMKARSCLMQTDGLGLLAPTCANSIDQNRELCNSKHQTLSPSDSATGQQHQRLQDNSERSGIHSDILVWLQSLLHSTQTSQGEPHQKSLLAMCLRKIPACIDDIDAWDKAMAQDQAPSSIHQTPDACLEIYSQLEEFGAAGLGWRPLKHTLRAHGVWSLKNAIMEGLFTPSQTAQLVRTCVKLGHFDEAQHLATAINGNLPLPRTAGSSLDEHATLEPIHVLVAAARGNKDVHLGPVFDGVSRLIREKQLPVPWLSTRGLSALLAAAIRAIGENQGGTTAIELLTVAAEALCTDRDKETWHDSSTRLETLTRMAAGLVTLAGRLPVAETRASFALDCCINEVRSQKGLCIGQGLFVLGLARFLAQGNGVSNLEGCKSEAGYDVEGRDSLTFATLSTSPAQFRQVLELVCSIAQGSSEGRLVPAHQSLMELCQKLERLPWPTWVLNGLRRDGAFLLAQKTNDLRDLAFAEGQVPLDQTRASARAKTMFSDWYWEEAIGEFVVRSPAKQNGDSAQHMEQPRTRPQTQHRPPQALWARHSLRVGQATEEKEATVSGSDSDIGLDIRNTQGGAADNSEQIDSISESAREEAVMTTLDEENTGTGRRSRVHATSSKPETKPGDGRACRGDMQGTAAKKHPRQVSGNGRNGLRLGFESRASIGGARQLFIVRGLGRSSTGEANDWLEW